MKKLLFLLLLLISSFAFSQENPSAVEDGIIKRCPIETKATWYSVYIGPIGIRKNITIVSDSTISGRVTKGAFKNSLGQPDTSTGYYMLGKIKQWKNRNSDYFYYRSDTTGAFWIQIEYINGPSLETGGISLSDLAQLGLINGDTTYFSVLKARLGNNKIYTTGSDGRNFLITNTTNEDSARIQISLSGNGGIVVNYYGATILGNSGNPQANDSIMIKFGMNNVYWKYSTAWTTNGQIGDPTTGVGVLSPNNTDSLIFRGLTNSTSGKYNFLGNFYINGTEVTTVDTSLFVKRSAFSQSIEATGGNVNIIGSILVTGRISIDTIFNPTTDLIINDSTRITGTLNVAGNTTLSNLSASNVAASSSGAFNILNRWTQVASADGVFAQSNWASTGFTSFTVGAGSITAGFIRGTSDTDITALMLRSPNGTLRYAWIDDSNNWVIGTSAP